MNYGLIFMGRGDYNQALDYFNRALVYTPNYFALEINLGVANGALPRRTAWRKRISTGRWSWPNSPEPYYFYGRWLGAVHRNNEAAPSHRP